MATNSSGESRPRDAEYWAKPVSRLKVNDVPAGATNLNVEGRQIVGPLQGFGQLWQKTYRVHLNGAQVTPAQVIKVWKENFAHFWPPGSNFYGSLTGVAPGDVAILNLKGPAGMPLSTGIIVIYADDESFSFMDPEGHMFAAMITFSAYAEDGTTVAQVQPLLRANDPIYEIGMRLGITHKIEDKFWRDTLLALAGHFGVQGVVEQRNTLVDPKVQWSRAKNIWHNAAIRTTIYALMTPFRTVSTQLKQSKPRRGKIK